MYALLTRAGLDTVGYLYQALSLNSDVQPLFNDALQEQYNLFDIRYVVTPSGWSVPNFYKTLGDFGRHRLYQVETTGYFDLVGSDLAFAGAKSEFFPAASAWLKSGLVKAKQHPAVFLDNAPSDGVLSDGRKVEPLSTAPQAFARISAVPGSARGRVISETVETGGYTADVEVLRDSLLMLKATYHPNWHATVDGVETPTVMLMPSYVGVPVAAGLHHIRLEYRTGPLRGILMAVGLLTLVLVATGEWFLAKRRHEAGAGEMETEPWRRGLSRCVGWLNPGRVRSQVKELIVPVRRWGLWVASGRSARGQGQPAIADSRSSERAAVIRLAVAGVLSALIYLVIFTAPYSLSRMQAVTQVDLSVLQARAGSLNWRLLLAIAAAGALYWYAWRVACRARGAAAWVTVIGGAVLSAGALLFMYPIGSIDIFDYIMRGRIGGIYHANPFVNVAAQFPGDVFIPYASWITTNTSPYGPSWELIAGIVVRMAGATVISNVIAFKLLAVLFLAGCALLIGLMLRRAAPERCLSGVLLLIWNPIVLFEIAGSGHNDMVMVFFILAAAAAIYLRRHTFGILLLVAGAMVKYIPVLMLPAATLIALRELPDRRARLRFLISASLLSVFLMVLCYAPFWHGFETVDMGRRGSQFHSSLPSLFLWLLQPRVPMGQAISLISGAALAVTVLFALVEGLRAWRDRSWLSFTRSAFHIVVFVILCTMLWLMPWYSLWPLALAALLPPGGATLLAQGMAFSLFGQPFVHAYLVLRQPGSSNSPWFQLRDPAVLGVPWLTAIVLLFVFFIGRLRRAASASSVGLAGRPNLAAISLYADFFQHTRMGVAAPSSALCWGHSCSWRCWRDCRSLSLG